jgi:hypothetical protein
VAKLSSRPAEAMAPTDFKRELSTVVEDLLDDAEELLTCCEEDFSGLKSRLSLSESEADAGELLFATELSCDREFTILVEAGVVDDAA